MQLGPEVEELVVSVLRSGIIAQGPMVARLERDFAEMIGVRHVVAVNNGTTALIAALQVLDLEPGDEVVTSPFTFVATLNAILQAGATARFADISADDFNITAALIEEQITERTKALMPVHLYGQTADMQQISKIATDRGLQIVEDAAQAHGATLGGRHAGSWGIGCFSLYATKNLTSGEGGLITTDDDDLADRLRLLRNQGMRARYQYEMAGNNYRLTDLQAAVCIPQLSVYDDSVAARQRNAEHLTEELADIGWLTTPTQLPGRRHVWHQYTILLDENSPITRDELSAHLESEGVGCGAYYPKVVYDYDCYRHDDRVRPDPVPVAESVARRCLSLPVHPRLDESQLATIASAVRSAVR